MPEEYFDIAYINFDKAILHGRIRGGIDANRCVIEAEVEQVLTEEQSEAVVAMNAKHDAALSRLLASFVDREAAFAKSAK